MKYLQLLTISVISCTLKCFGFNNIPVFTKTFATRLLDTRLRATSEKVPDVRSVSSILREHPEESDVSSLLISDVADYGIRTALAEEHIELGNFNEAFKLAKEAIDMADHTREPDNIYSAYAEGILADALYGQGKFKEAAGHFKAALQTYERHYRSNSGPEAVELVGAMQIVAWNALSKKDYDEALVACQTALGITKKLMGPNNADVAACMVNLAIARLHKQDAGEGTEALLQKAYKIYDDLKSSGAANSVDAQLCTIYTALGDLYNQRDETDMARNSYQKVEKMFKKGKISGRQAAGARKSLIKLEWKIGELDGDVNHLLAVLEKELEEMRQH